MLSVQTKRRIFWLAECMLLVAAIATTTQISQAQEWSSLPLAALLLSLTLIGLRLGVTLRSQQVDADFLALVLAMSLLGPVPAVCFGTVAIAVSSAARRISPIAWLNNLTNYAVFPLTGGLLIRLVIGNVHDPHNHHLTQSITFGLVVFGVFMVTNALNFATVAADIHVTKGRSFIDQAREVLIPLMPGQVATGAVAAILAVAYTNLGISLLFGSVLLLLIFQYLAVALLRSEERAAQLEARSIHLASLQLGVLTTLVETLALRDRMTARHAAAVARYAQELAREVGCDEAEQDLVHTAGLLHDIGKFALPDSILHAEVLSDQDWAVIRRHPQDGATLVGRLDGYGPVADAILYHHEHIDGSGYPAGLIGNEIPLPSRIIAVCSTYDTLTARETYRSPMTPQDAIAELRRVSGRQLDGELVESFIAMLEREGPVTSAHGDDADFEVELAFERRARKIAQPSSGG
ncbi:MAG: HD-GYP domain-containing protein [Solirubrobacterales bacterium]